MAHEERLVPSARALLDSLRDIGYSLDTAVADIVDNSISAGATTVDIRYADDGADPFLAICDNGCGMSGEEIIEAMRHGGASRSSPENLGKFGLGLKTASFSQCRRLVVVSNKDGICSGVEWDLDLVERRDDWVVRVLSRDDVRTLARLHAIPSTGTLVLWRNLDRLLGGASRAKRSVTVNQQLIDTQRHMGLVFHRFLTGKATWRPAVLMRMNGHPIAAHDPFFLDNTATQRLPEETVYIDAHSVDLKAYVLPHYSKLGPDGHALYASHADLASNQGVYVHRNDRLIAWGGWLRQVPKSESTKLARISIDYTSALDGYWTIDVKKSRVKAPREVLDTLRKILDPIAERTIRTVKGRGQRVITTERSSLWQRTAGRDGILYEIRRDHPLIRQLSKPLPHPAKAKLELLLHAVADELPVQMICVDGVDDRHDRNTATTSVEDAVERLKLVLQTLPEHKRNCERAFRDVAAATRLFSDSVIDQFISQEMA